jgi:hypothetical protein
LKVAFPVNGNRFGKEEADRAEHDLAKTSLAH